MREKVFGAVFALLGLLVILTPRYILPVCEFKGFKPMHCSEAAHFELYAGLALIGIGLGAAFLRGRAAGLVLGLLAAAAGAAVIYIPQATGFCKSPMMPCHYGAVPALRLLGGITILAGLAGAWRMGRSGGGPSAAEG